MQLSVEIHPGNGPCLLLVHGFLTGRAQWKANLAALAEVCRPVVVELWGHGRSPSPDDAAHYHPEFYISEFERIRTAIGVPDWLICGYSLGAGLTIRYALAHPERVRAHAFTNSTSGFAEAEQVEAWASGGEAAAERILEGGQAAIERIPVHPRHARRLAPDLYAALIANAREHNPAGIARTVQHTTPRLSVRALAHNNTRPALLINGKRERRFQEMRDFIEQTMPATTIVDLAAGHGVNMEAKDEFNSALVHHVRTHR